MYLKNKLYIFFCLFTFLFLFFCFHSFIHLFFFSQKTISLSFRLQFFYRRGFKFFYFKDTDTFLCRKRRKNVFFFLIVLVCCFPESTLSTACFPNSSSPLVYYVSEGLERNKGHTNSQWNTSHPAVITASPHSRRSPSRLKGSRRLWLSCFRVFCRQPWKALCSLQGVL